MKHTYRYSILTFIFGNYECLREVQDKKEDIEYVCITDNKYLVSSTWKIVQYENNNHTPFRKVVEVRYNPFKYVNSNICLIIDGSIQLRKHPNALFKEFDKSNYEIAVLVHPDRCTIAEELNAWKNIRHIPIFDIDVCNKLVTNIHYDNNYRGLFQVGILLVKKTSFTTNIFNQILSMNNNRALKNNTFRIDQLLFSIVANRQHDIKEKLLPLTSNELNGKYFTYFKHGTNTPVRHNSTDYVQDIKYVFNTKYECHYIDDLQYMNDDITAVICNYNTTQLTNNVIKGLQIFAKCKHIIVLDNSNKDQFILDKTLNNEYIQVIDNTKQKYIQFDNLLQTYKLSELCKTNNYASLKHAMSIQFLLDICITKYCLLCDSDIVIKKKIDFIEDGYSTIAGIEQTGTASQNMNKNLGKTRFVPFMQLFNMKMLNLHKIRYFDINRIHGIEYGMMYDTGASLYEDIVERKQLPYKQVNIEQYITHLGHGSWK